MNEHGYYGIALANKGWLAWRDGDNVSAVNLCQAAFQYWSQYVGVYALQSLAVWVLLAIAVSHQDLQEANHWALALLDTSPDIQPVLEPMASLLSKALSAYKGNEAQASYQFFAQALEAAKAAGDL